MTTKLAEATEWQFMDTQWRKTNGVDADNAHAEWNRRCDAWEKRLEVESCTRDRLTALCLLTGDRPVVPGYVRVALEKVLKTPFGDFRI